VDDHAYDSSLIIDVAMKSNKFKHLVIKTKKITVFFSFVYNLVYCHYTDLFIKTHNLETTECNK